MGKPSPVIYEAASRLLNLAPCDIVAVGDSLEHDIGGKTLPLAETLLPD